MSKSRILHGSGLALVLALSFGAAAPAAAAEPKPVPAKTGEALKKMAEAYDRDDCDSALRLGTPLVDGKAAAGLPADLQTIVYDVVAFCESGKDMDDQAYAHALRGTALDEASDELWRLRLFLELQADRHDAAVATVEAMTQGRGAALNGTPLSWIWDLNRALKESGKQDLRMRLLQVLAGEAYAPEELDGDTDGFRYEYAQFLIERGEVDRAGAITARLRGPSTLAMASLEPRLHPFLPAGLDVRAAAEAQLARNREAIARRPDLLHSLLEGAMVLRQLGRPQEALALLQSVSNRIDDPAAFADRDERLNWYWDALGRTWSMLGRYDEMIAAFGKGAAMNEGGSPNVSQVINLAEYQNGFGRAEEALKTLEAFADKRESSPYGEMEMRFARGCAFALAGRPAEAAPDLAFARAHEKDHPEALADLLLCMGDMDGAAAAFIRRLEDPERRIDALLQLSDYDEPPVARPADPVESRLPALKARPDVKAAIERAGGVRRFRLQRGEL